MADQQEELIEKVRALMIKKYGDDSTGSMRKLFDEYDANKDQQISSKELDALLKDAGIGNVMTRPVWVKGVIRALDESGDSLVSWDEFFKAVSKEA